MTRTGHVILLVMAATAASAADWASLNARQRTLTRAEFDDLATANYAPQGGLSEYLQDDSNSVSVFSSALQTGAPLFRLEFALAPSVHPSIRPPFSSLCICLDPGHIGGEWARTEERFFIADRNDWYVQEAVLNLYVARLLKVRLESAGAEVRLTKDGLDPITDKRPADFERDVSESLGNYEHYLDLPDLFREAARRDSVRKRSEAAFFRASEIEARARKISAEIRPDVTICLHFNARDTENPHELIEDNGLAVFVHGNYLPGELKDEEQRFCLFRKLLEGSHGLEMGLAESIASSMAQGTGLLPAYHVKSGAMFPVGTNDYLYARNLAASREFPGPVVFLEPYFMNNRVVYRRIQLGDYDGERDVDGVSYRSIFREYADGVFAGVTNFFGVR